MTKGRPRAFDIDEALDKAVEVFWRKGYEGASLGELTAAMGINPPSLYAAFGNKEALYRQVLARYTSRARERRLEVLSQPTARAAIQTLLMKTAEWLTDHEVPVGCLLARSAFASEAVAGPAWQDVLARREEGLGLIRDRLRCAKREGDLPKGANPETLARFFQTVIEGMSVQAVSGVSRKDLEAVAKQAMCALDDKLADQG